jgi:hypothetical protein
VWLEDLFGALAEETPLGGQLAGHDHEERPTSRRRLAKCESIAFKRTITR